MVSLPSRPPTADELTEFEDGECYPVELPTVFIERYTSPGDLVFDPFAGSGTTLLAARRLGRRAAGWEIHPERVDWCTARLDHPTLVTQADATVTPPPPGIDLVMTSPPYMTARHHPENPLTGYQTLDGDYRTYLRQLTRIFGRFAAALNPGGHLVVNVAELTMERHLTPLATDLAAALATVATPVDRIRLDWDVEADWYREDCCLVFGPPDHLTPEWPHRVPGPARPTRPRR